MDCSTPGFPVHHQLPELAQTHLYQISGANQPFHPLSSPSPPAFNLSQHQGLFHSLVCIHWPKYWSFSFSISPYNENSGLISFRIDWFDLLAVQETQSLLQYHTWKHQFSGAQLSLWPDSTSVHGCWKTIALTRWTFVGKVMSLFFNMLSRLAIAFLPRSKRLLSFFFLISWRLITLQYCSGFCHTLTWISHGFTCLPHSDPPSHLPLYLILLGLPSAPGSFYGSLEGLNQIHSFLFDFCPQPLEL